MTATHYALLGALLLLAAAAIACAALWDQRDKARADAYTALAEAEEAREKATDNEAAARHWEAAYNVAAGQWRERAVVAEAGVANLAADYERLHDEVAELVAEKIPADPAWTDGAETMRGAVVRLLNGWKSDERRVS